MEDNIRVRIDGKEWQPSNGDTAKYDAIHAAAGAVLAGAGSVIIERKKAGEAWDNE